MKHLKVNLENEETSETVKLEGPISKVFQKAIEISEDKKDEVGQTAMESMAGTQAFLIASASVKNNQNPEIKNFKTTTIQLQSDQSHQVVNQLSHMVSNNMPVEMTFYTDHTNPKFLSGNGSVNDYSSKALYLGNSDLNSIESKIGCDVSSLENFKDVEIEKIEIVVKFK